MAATGLLHATSWAAPQSEDGAGSVDPWTRYGGSGADTVADLLVLPGGDVIVVGSTTSEDLPGVTGAFDADYGAAGPGSAEDDRGDGYVARLSPRGERRWASYIGGGGWDAATAIAALPQGDVIVVGWTRSNDLGVTEGALDEQCGNEEGCEFRTGDAFVSRWSPEGAIRWATYLGGSLEDAIYDVEVDPSSGELWLVGHSASPDLPILGGGRQPHPRQGERCWFAVRMWAHCYDTLVARMSPDGQALRYVSFVGGGELESATQAALRPGGGLYIAGSTSSGDFPTSASAYDRDGQDEICGFVSSRCTEGFVLGLDAAGDLRFSTLLGGSGYESIHALQVDAGGDLLLSGRTSSVDLPWSVEPFGLADGHLGKGYPTYDGFLARLSSDGSRLLDLARLAGPDRGFDIVSSGSLGHAVDGAILIGLTGAVDGRRRSTASTGLAGPATAVVALDPGTFEIRWGVELGPLQMDLGVLSPSPDGAIVAAGSVHDPSYVGEGVHEDDVFFRRLLPRPVGIFGRLSSEAGPGIVDATVSVQPAVGSTSPETAEALSTTSGPDGIWSIDGLPEGTFVVRPKGRGLWIPDVRHVSASTRVSVDFHRVTGVAGITPRRLDDLSAGDRLTVTVRVGHDIATAVDVVLPLPAGADFVPGSVRGGREVVHDPELRRVSAVVDLDDRGRGSLSLQLRLDATAASLGQLRVSPCVEAPRAPCLPARTGAAHRHGLYLPWVTRGIHDPWE